MDASKPPAPLGHLSTEQLHSLVTRFYQGESAKNLVKEFGIACTAAKLHSIMPPALISGRLCPACGVQMQIAAVNRASSRYGYLPIVVRCSACEHYEHASCGCAYCVRARQQLAENEENRRRDLIREFLGGDGEIESAPRTVASLSLREAVAFISMVRACGYINETTLGSIDFSGTPLSPTYEYSQELIELLRNSRLIQASLQSSTHAFTFNESEITHIYFERLSWDLLVTDAKELVRELENVALSGNWPASWHEESEALWSELAFAEAIQFFALCSQQRGWRPNLGDATNAMLKNLLRDHSVAQCYRIVWTGAQQTADYKVRKNISNPHAANVLIGACQRWADRARVENWEVKPFRRNFELPRTVVSYVLHDVFFKIGERGFSERIRTINPAQPYIPEMMILE